MMVYGVQQRKSAIMIHTLPPSPPHRHTSLDHHRALGWAPCVTQQLLTSHAFHTRQCVYVKATFSIGALV